MYNKKQVELIESLYIQGNASSNVLSSQLGISKRTVISYVKDINKSNPDGDLIISSNHGYSINQDIFSEIKDELPDLTDNDVNERIELITKAFLTGFRDTINMYDIGERLHYSESTIRSSLYRIKGLVKKYGLDIQLSNNSATLIGEEEGKRELYFSLFEDTLERNLYDFTKLNMLFPQYTSDRIYRVFDDCIKQYYHNVCDFEKVSLFYRFLITMDRVSHGHFITNEPYTRFMKEEDIMLGEQVTSQIGKITGVIFPDIEVRYIIEIFTATCIYGRLSSNVTPESLKDDLWPKCYSLVEECADEIFKIYNVDIRQNRDEYVDFAMHVRALIRRMNAGVRIHNPYRSRLKRDCVAAYDCAIFVALKIHRLYPFPIGEDDIADLAISLGAAFEQNFDYSTIMRGLFVLPYYYSVHEDLYKYYKDEFDSKIRLERVSDISDCNYLDSVDVVVSTLSLKDLGGKKFLRISPIQNASDRNRLDEMINGIRHDKMIESLKEIFKNMSDEDRFYYSPPEVNDRESAIEYMVRPLIESGTADESFKEKILEREEIDDNGVDLIAVLCTPEYCAKEDTMSLMISQKPIPWGDRQVHAILLFTSEEGNYQPMCMRVVRRLIHVMGRRDTPKKISQCRSFKEFNNLLI